MNKIKIREIELMSKVCARNEIPTTLGKALLKMAKNEAYKNNTQATRVKEYQNLIDFHFKEKN
ncbi:hypothetical protein GJU40_12955 [Bacillus lacus]|uniref:Uncharacterized protein n=1 Tax=Metabacillus lacus TaxID=1983721 RepID=A0A7X2J085_9BACI|nr:DNA modification system-associated small protein [Metabacillus lacus]MRX73050.1 hypothetical protein [Metabacillus lacus]